ncbi:MAG: hypothetical protein Q7S42_04290 [Candidatus Omnitrophota bacterium]|nr:hypothetical protein [Candidatus Omnitrophota bacterium]
MKRNVILNDLKESDIRPDNVYDRYKELLQEDIRKYFIVSDNLQPVPCPGCGSGKIQKTFLVMGLRYCVCGRCASWYVSPRPSEKQLGIFHKESLACIYLRNNLFEKTRVVRTEEIFSYRLQWIRGLVEEYLPDAKVFVDRGSRYPALLSQMVKEKLFQKITLLAPECFEQESLLPQGAEIFCDKLPQKYADVYAVFEQIERSYEPKRIIEEAAQACKPGGIFVLTTTSSSGFEYQVLCEHSPNLIPFDRLNLLSFEALLELLKSHGFKVVEASTPGRLDVEIVRKTFEKSGDIPEGRLWKYIFDHRSPEALHTLQEFLQRFQLSSHVRIAAIKDIGGGYE